MGKFEHLKKLDVTKDQTSRYKIYQIEGEPWLLVRSAAEANKPYFNALLKRSRKNLRRLRAGSVNAAQIAENRDEDRQLYPKHIVLDWGDIKDNEGVAVPFSEENCVEFLEDLPDWIFDDLRVHCSDVMNFLPENADLPIDIEETGKN